MVKLNKKVKKSGVIGSLPVGMKFDPQQGKDLQKFMTDISKNAQVPQCDKTAVISRFSSQINNKNGIQKIKKGMVT